jgi:hypothetical protein
MTVAGRRGVFVVRIWLEGEGAAWRASVLDTATQERRYFSAPHELGAFWAAVAAELGAETPLEGNAPEGC